MLDLAWFAYQRSDLSSSVAIECRAAALTDPGEGDVYFSRVVQAGQQSMVEALEATGVSC